MAANQYIDMLARKEYTYSYEDGRITRAAECDIAFGADEIVNSKVLVSSVLYTYDAEGTLTHKRIRLADGTERIVWFETTDDNTVALKWQGSLFYGLNTFSDVRYAANNWGTSISAFLKKRKCDKGTVLLSHIQLWY